MYAQKTEGKINALENLLLVFTFPWWEAKGTNDQSPLYNDSFQTIIKLVDTNL